MTAPTETNVERAFKGVWIPAEIYLDQRLTPTEVCLLAEIESLDLGEGCQADNKYLSGFAKCDVRSVTRYLSHLRAIGLINVTTIGGERRIYRHRPRMAPEIPEIKPRPRFVPPTVEEVKAYCDERQNGVDAEEFVDFYTAKGWYIGKNKVKDWQAAVRTWERKRCSDPTDGTLKHNYTKAQLDSVLITQDKLAEMERNGELDWGDDD